MALLFDFSKFYTNLGKGCGYSVLWFDFQNIIWWWELESKEGCLQQPVTLLDDFVKIKSIQDDEWAKMRRIKDYFFKSMHYCWSLFVCHWM